MSDADADADAAQPVCGVDGCAEIARYVESGDGHAIQDPRLRCHGHKPDGGLWRDMLTAVRGSYLRYLDVDAGPEAPGHE